MDRLKCRKIDRLVLYYRNEQYVDCVFKIDGIEVKAHRLVLASVSPVFEKMFYGDLSQDVVDIEDASVEEFKQVLEYIYTDDIEIKSVTNAWNLFYIANKYLLDDLVEKCVNYIDNNLSICNLVVCYEYSDMYGLIDIKKKCFSNIINYINGVFYFDDYHVKVGTIRAILDEIEAPTIDLLMHIIEWCVTECQIRKKSIIPRNIIEILNDECLLGYFNRNSLDLNYCNKLISNDLVKEVLILLTDLLDYCKEPYNLSISQIKTPHYCKLRKEFKIASRIDLNSNDAFVTHFTVNNRLIIFGLSIITPMQPASKQKSYNFRGEIAVKLMDESGKELVEEMVFNKVVPYNSSDFYVRFYNLVVLEPNTLYNFRISFRDRCLKSAIPLHCFYMSDVLLSDVKGCSMTFYEVNGSVIKGVAFYPK